MASRLTATAALLGLSALGYTSIIGLTARNGWGERFNEYNERAVAVLPDTEIPARTHFTGVPGVDHIFVQAVKFFYPCVVGQLPALPLFSLYFAGQVIALHSLLVLEGLRLGNKGTIFAYTAIWGSLYQCVPFGITIPIYCALYLWLSPLAKYSKGPKRIESLSIESVQAFATLPAIILGFVVPSALPALPSPRIVSLEQKQLFLIVWQFFPILVSISHRIFTVLAPKVGLVKASTTLAGKYDDAKEVYRQVIYMAQISHIAVMTFVFIPQAVQAVFKISDISSINPFTVFLPMSIVSPRQVTSMAEGALSLLQYDFYCGSAALLGLVSYLSGSAYGFTAGVWTATKILLKSLLVGPGAALLWAFWDRDEEALRDAGVEKSEKKDQ
ncbi:unnamed protein product [Parascedosporium putredinis]|uniref:Uncharacterized protein n=1 Tax=Parascedosporium putredinis TaxID=1442378 RepID=A0A9P1H208_9PEZI|nr:unnamed protein product [Parascedosporium putredinis]CAI7993562.1 unnamed protein product [Parascedosporium putredinis]